MKKKLSTPNRSSNSDTPITKQVRAISAHAFSGPIPPPALFQGYETVLPGSADRILSMAERENAHRHNLENKGQKAAIYSEFIGIFCALLLSLVFIGAGVYVAVQSNSYAGSALAAFPVLAIVTIFVQGRKRHSQK